VLTTKTTPSVGDGTGPIGANARDALCLLRQARTCAHDAGADLWDFALELATLFGAGLTVSDLRWLVAKGFVEHGQETSAYGGPHRSFRRGAGFFFEGTTCLVLTPSGAAFAERFLIQPDARLQPGQLIEAAPLPGGATVVLANGQLAAEDRPGTTHVALRPSWNDARRELTLDGRLVKQFRVPARNQATILAAFEEEGWPDHIDDPLPMSGDINPPTRLHDAINRLNGCQVHRLLHFSGNGAGTGVCWKLRRAAGLRVIGGPATGAR
jgi:hypothetical protein